MTCYVCRKAGYMRTQKILGKLVRTRVDPLLVNLCDIVTTRKNNSIQDGIVQNITLKGVNVVRFGARGVEFVKWCDVLSVKKNTQ